MTRLAPVSPPRSEHEAGGCRGSAGTVARGALCWRLVCLGLVASLGAPGREPPAWADETTVQDQPVAEAYERSPGWLERVFDLRFRKKTLLPRLKDALASQPPFLSDTELVAHIRTYYLLVDIVFRMAGVHEAILIAPHSRRTP